ncbi:hypothetical protein SLA2020_221680 [Shorea laevis]
MNKISKELEAEANKVENRRLMVKEESSKAPSAQVSQTREAEKDIMNENGPVEQMLENVDHALNLQLIKILV